LHGFVLRLIGIAHFVLMSAAFAFCWNSFYRMEGSGAAAYNGLFVLFYATVWFLLSRIYRAYELGFSRVMELIYSHALTAVICGCGAYAANGLAAWEYRSPMPVLGLIAVQCGASALWAMAANWVYYRFNAPKRTAVVYRSKADLERLNAVRNFSYKFRIEKYIENPGDFRALLKELEGFEAVFVVGVNATLRNGVAKFCVDNDIYGYFAPHVGDIILSGAVQTHAFGVPVMKVCRAKPTLEYMAAKRAFDVAASLAALIAASPVMAVTALAIRLYDGGPALYRQVRVTKDGRQFHILKFRSMRVDAEKDGVARLASAGDSRITPVGRFIRACRIDELPQLINILRGEMSIVGPRPERPEIAAEYEKVLPAFRLRLQVKAGLTGYAQVYGRYNTEPYDKLQMDLIYISRMSFVEDLKLIFATIKILFIRESTQGVAAGQVTAFHEEQDEKSA